MLGDVGSEAIGEVSRPTLPSTTQKGRSLPNSTGREVPVSSRGPRSKEVEPRESASTLWSSYTDMQQDKKPKLPPSEDQVQRRIDELKHQAREHGFELSKRPVDDLGALGLNHNE
ncbi:unnamed protein product, partial [Polarella glacialis]